jgi:predicted transcriptional regulator
MLKNGRLLMPEKYIHRRFYHEDIWKLAKEGNSVCEIAVILDCTRTTVYKYLAEYREALERREERENVKRIEILLTYEENGESVTRHNRTAEKGLSFFQEEEIIA